MAAQMLRASYTISASTLARFNAAIPLGERSRVVEQYMELALQAREAHLEKVAAAFVADPASAESLTDDALWEATAADGLQGL